MSVESWLTDVQCLHIEREIDALCRTSKHLEAANLANAYISQVQNLSEFHSRAIYLQAFSYFLGGYYIDAWEKIQIGMSVVNKLPSPAQPRLYLLACEIAIACRRTAEANSYLSEYYRIAKHLKTGRILEVQLMRIELVLNNEVKIASKAERMAHRFLSAGNSREAVFVLCDLGLRHFRNGDTERAEKIWRRALKFGHAAPTVHADLLIHLGRNQQLKGRLQSALDLYTQAAELANNSWQRCDALIRKSLVRMDLNQVEEASEELKNAVNMLTTPYPDSLLPLIRFALMNVDGIEMEWGNNDDAGPIGALNNDSWDADNEVSRKAYRRGHELWIAGLDTDAESWLRAAWQYAQKNSNPEVAWRSALFLGRITSKRESKKIFTKEGTEYPESFIWLERALDVLEKQSETIDTPVNRAHYRFQLRTVVVELLEGSIQSNDVLNAYRYSELLRGRLFSDFSLTLPKRIVTSKVKGIKRSLLTCLGLGGTSRESFRGLEAVKRRLSLSQVFISLSELNSCISAIVVTKNSDPVIRYKEFDGELLRSARNDLERCVEKQLLAYQHGADLKNLKQEFCDMIGAISKSEFGQLLSNILGEFEQQHILLSLDGRLGNIPVHALPVHGRHLIETRDVVYVPTGDWLSRDTKLSKLTKRSVGLLVSESEESLPSAKAEAIQIKSRFQRSIHLHAMEADSKRIGNAAKICDFLHFACHGETNSHSPLEASLQLPSGEKWTAEFVAKSLALKGKLCVLNCCKTGDQRKQVAGEAFSIATSFLAAGAVGVVGALWSLPDEESALLIGKFYEYLAEESPSRALARVQRFAITTNMHPVFWAPLVYVGTCRERPKRFGFI